MKYRIIFLPILLCLLWAWAPAQEDGHAGRDASDAAVGPAAPPETLVMDYRAFERRVLNGHPVLDEKALDVEKKRLEEDKLKASAILPRFEVDMGVGPAPGLRRFLDTSGFAVVGDDTHPVLSTDREYDFSEWGPFFGVEMKVAQPLNVRRYRAAREAARRQVKVAEAELRKEDVQVSFEAQEIFFRRMYARTMRDILQKASVDLGDAENKLEEMLDEGETSISQKDLLELKAGRYALEKGLQEASTGLRRASLQMRFMLRAFDAPDVAAPDTVLVRRTEALPPLDSLKALVLSHHPDLQRLENGLAARRELVRVAKGELGPDIFLFGQFRYAKSWSSERATGADDPFVRDPLNELTGVGGIGLKLHLNFWQRYQKYRKERTELLQLRKTEVYAARGLLLRLEDAHLRYLEAAANVDESARSLRAAEAWLKGAAMTYDLDPTTAKDMIRPYRTTLYAKRDYFEAVLEYNLAVARVLQAAGWTLSDYFDNLPLSATTEGAAP